MRIISKLLPLLSLIAIFGLASCVHEWPEAADQRVVTLTVRHSLDWDYLEHITNVRSSASTRGDDDTKAPAGPSMETVRYIFRVYPAGNQKVMYREFVRYSDDTSRADYTTELPLPPGDWDIHVWSDYVDDVTHANYFYCTDEFGSISLLDEYMGYNRRKDAFRGTVSVSVPTSIESNVSVSGVVDMERPLASYAFVATDLREFVIIETTRWEAITRAEEEARRRQYIEEALRRGLSIADAEREADLRIAEDRLALGLPADPNEAPVKIPDYSDYTVTFYYTGFLPSVFNHFSNRPTDSKTGQFYTATVSKLSETDALLGFDHVFVNGHESSVKVQMTLADPRGNVIATSPAIDVPVSRGRCTIVKGEFLTSKTSGGVGINPDFDGDFNIEIH